TRTCATPTLTAARMRRIGAREQSIGWVSNDTQERISRTSRWKFWQSCPRQAERWRRNNLRATTRPELVGCAAQISSDVLFPDETHVCPPTILAKQHHIVLFWSSDLHADST